MEYQYVVIKQCNSWDLEYCPTKIICIVTSEEEAKQIVTWLEHNDRQFDSFTQAYGYVGRKVFDNIAPFIKDYLETNSED